jgi:hypothetical protein
MARTKVRTCGHDTRPQTFVTASHGAQDRGRTECRPCRKARVGPFPRLVQAYYEAEQYTGDPYSREAKRGRAILRRIWRWPYPWTMAEWGLLKGLPARPTPPVARAQYSCTEACGHCGKPTGANGTAIWIPRMGRWYTCVSCRPLARVAVESALREKYPQTQWTLRGIAS